MLSTNTRELYYVIFCRLCFDFAYRCFHSVNVNNLPVVYRNNKSAWMTQILFVEWIKSIDLRMRYQNRLILMFVDNFSGHALGNTVLTNVSVKFFPPRFPRDR